MITIILQEQSLQANNRFKQRSREVIDIILPLLAQQKVTTAWGVSGEAYELGLEK